ncbi:uncharacterized protein Bfra_010562 [Botrytis fragariae]|uniref:Uncharacterized protein n=1 Tax=Botrytis fragariae TaxID=1964551 RepID=A0A8H6ECM7_9HELO|nr:uncharacterized protein Bfra_010562 [Botrytis fragariae]KAF5867587.1 hypothetical protein Bfra_010562 [Botrytis fragariae]
MKPSKHGLLLFEHSSIDTWRSPSLLDRGWDSQRSEKKVFSQTYPTSLESCHITNKYWLQQLRSPNIHVYLILKIRQQKGLTLLKLERRNMVWRLKALFWWNWMRSNDS